MTARATVIPVYFWGVCITILFISSVFAVIISVIISIVSVISLIVAYQFHVFIIIAVIIVSNIAFSALSAVSIVAVIVAVIASIANDVALIVVIILLISSIPFVLSIVVISSTIFVLSSISILVSIVSVSIIVSIIVSLVCVIVVAIVIVIAPVLWVSVTTIIALVLVLWLVIVWRRWRRWHDAIVLVLFLLFLSRRIVLSLQLFNLLIHATRYPHVLTSVGCIEQGLDVLLHSLDQLWTQAAQVLSKGSVLVAHLTPTRLQCSVRDFMPPRFDTSGLLLGMILVKLVLPRQGALVQSVEVLLCALISLDGQVLGHHVFASVEVEVLTALHPLHQRLAVSPIGVDYMTCLVDLRPTYHHLLGWRDDLAVRQRRQVDHLVVCIRTSSRERGANVRPSKYLAQARHLTLERVRFVVLKHW